MGRPSTTKTIGGYEVSTTRLAPTKALKLAPKLTKLIIPMIRLQNAAAIMQATGDADRLVHALTEIIGTIDDATLDMLYRELLCDTSIILPNDNGVMSVHELNTPQMVDIAFGRVDEGLTLLVQVMIFVGEVNFKKHFLDVIARMGLKTKSTASSEKPAE
jgi:hypothetical protein